MNKSYEQLQNSVVFYRWLASLMFAIIVSLLVLVFSYDDVNTDLQSKYDTEQAKTKVLQEELAKELKDFKDALCLPRIAKFDKEMGLS